LNGEAQTTLVVDALPVRIRCDASGGATITAMPVHFILSLALISYLSNRLVTKGHHYGYCILKTQTLSTNESLLSKSSAPKSSAFAPTLAFSLLASIVLQHTTTPSFQ
jgi:hypothetical protein